jgi:hypothetical protein
LVVVVFLAVVFLVVFLVVLPSTQFPLSQEQNNIFCFSQVL